jgi:hypothetical protein
MERGVAWTDQESHMADPSYIVHSAQAAESVTTFEWRKLHLHVVTRDPMSPDQVRSIDRVLRKVSSVGEFADALGIVLGRRVRIKTERPSPDIRLEVGL